MSSIEQLGFIDRHLIDLSDSFISQSLQSLANAIILRRDNEVSCIAKEISKSRCFVEILCKRPSLICSVDAPLTSKILMAYIIVKDDVEFLSLARKVICRIDLYEEIDAIRAFYAVVAGRRRRITQNIFITREFLKSISRLDSVLEKKIETFSWRIFQEKLGLDLSSENSKHKGSVVFCLNFIGKKSDATFVAYVKSYVSSFVDSGYDVEILFCGEDEVDDPYLENLSYTAQYKKFHNDFWPDLTGKKPHFVTPYFFGSITKDFVSGRKRTAKFLCFSLLLFLYCTFLYCI